ncbi:MAG: nucleotidyltransferase domain-containing protein [Nitrososphaerota archaeon]
MRGMYWEEEEGRRFRWRMMDERDREQVLTKVRELLEADNDVVLAVVHGSFLSGGPFRDLDIAVYVRGGVDALDKKIELERALEEATGLPVDVSVLNEAPAWFVRRALSNCKVLVERYPVLERLYLMSVDASTENVRD